MYFLIFWHIWETGDDCKTINLRWEHDPLNHLEYYAQGLNDYQNEHHLPEATLKVAGICVQAGFSEHKNEVEKSD